MLNIDQKQLIKRYQTLVKPLQDIIFSDQTSDKIRKSCVLREVEQHIATIAKLVGFVLMGYLRPELLALEIQKETGVDMQKARLIAQDLDTEIFSAVRLELKKLYPPTIQTPTVQTWQSESRSMNYESRKTAEPPAKPRYVIPIPEKFLRQSADATKFNVARPAESGEVRPPTKSQDATKFNVARSDLQQPINKPASDAYPKTNSVDDNLKSAGGGTTSQQAEVKPQPTPAPDSKTNSSGDDLKPAGGDQVSQKPADQYGETRSPTTGSIDHPEVNRLQITPQINVSQQAETKSQEPVFKPIVPLPTFIQTQFRTTQVDSNMASPGLQQRESTAAPDQAQRQISQQQAKTQQAEAGTQEGSLANDPRIKSLISRFTSSSTQKPKPPAESPYREKV